MKHVSLVDFVHGARHADMCGCIGTALANWCTIAIGARHDFMVGTYVGRAATRWHLRHCRVVRVGYRANIPRTFDMSRV